MATVLDQPRSWQPSADYLDPADKVMARLGTDAEDGLPTDVALKRLSEEGPNSLGKPKRISPLRMLLQQFTSSVVLLLIVAAIISATLREYLQTLGITAAIFINAGIGFFTENQARISLEKLATLTRSTVRITRGGQEYAVPSTDLVRGDVVVLEAGDRIPADLQLISTAAVSVDESILTGESVPVSKASISGDPDEKILFQGTTVSSGRARAIVVATGQATRLGRLSITIAELEQVTTPLEAQLDKLGRKLTLITVVLCVVFAVIGITQGLRPLVMLETAIALAVAAIPEGLPVVATLSLALGIQEMVRCKALVRRLPAVEALGSASVICTDKTGTLTQNKMFATEVVGCCDRYTISGIGYNPSGEFESVDTPDEPPNRHRLQQLLLPAVLCNDAKLENHGDGWHVHGDPTEGALLVAGAKIELDQASSLKDYPRVAEMAFNLQRKRMSTVHQTPDGKLVVYCKGSPGGMLEICTSVLEGDKVVPMEQRHKDFLLQHNYRMADEGLRVLAVAMRNIDRLPTCLDEEFLESDLTFLCLVAMKDPTKPEVQQALEECRSAGIRVIMLTGDQARTAMAIGRQLGICKSEDELLSGDAVTSMSDEELTRRLKSTSVFARVTPELKLLLVQKLQQLGKVVAMTGDGVNDAPALKQADIGVAMGKSGSDLARDAASLVITDDNFATIVKAISQGRQIYNKIKSAIAYLLSASMASLAVTVVGVFLHEGLLLTPLQLLWLNLIMHVFPAIGLVLQQNWDDLMNVPPRKRGEQLMSGPVMLQIAVRSGVVSAATLLCAWLDKTYFHAAGMTTTALVTISSGLLLLSWTWLRSGDTDERGLATLKRYQPMLINTAIGYGLIVGALYVPGLNTVLETTPLDASRLAMALGLSLLCYVPFLSFWTKLRRTKSA